jgi:hypothetical protein
VNTERIILSEAGIARSDAIGPWLNSQAVQERMQDFVLR